MFACLLLACAASAPEPPAPDAEDASFLGKTDGAGCLAEGTPEAAGVLALVNDPDVSAEELDDAAGLYRRAAYEIVDARPIADLAALDDVPWVGTATCQALARYACNETDRCRRTVRTLTWNVEHFPLTPETEDAVVEVVEQLNPDVVGLQEVDDTDAFQDMLERLPEYDGILGEPGPFTQVAILVRHTTMELLSAEDLFVDDWYAFPRPVLGVTVKPHGAADAFTLFDVHLKAMGDESSKDRRRSAVAKLRALLDARRAPALVAGDWNDELTAPSWTNVFTDLTDPEARATFLTLPAEEAGAKSYVPWSRMLDHVLATDELDAVLDHDETRVLDLDITWRADFVSTVSDHRPVLSTFEATVRY